MIITIDWKLAIVSLLTGIVLGALFGLFKLPVPAPAVLEGALGVVGTYLGGAVVGPYLRTLIERMFTR